MKTKQLAFLSVALLCASITADVSAGQLATCEKTIAPARSKVRLQVGKVKPHAIYTGVINSGSQTYSYTKAANALGVAELDFDSNPKDIRAGKKAIPAKFIDNEINVWVYDAIGSVIAQKAGVVCTTK